MSSALPVQAGGYNVSPAMKRPVNLSINRSVERLVIRSIKCLTIRPEQSLLVSISLFILMITVASAALAEPPLKQQLLWQKLQVSIADTDRELDGILGVSIQDLSSGEQFSLHGDEVFPQAAQGKLKLTDLYTVNSADLVADSYIMNGLTPGVTRITLRDLATMMVAVSDNSATNVLIDRVGIENVNALLDSLNLPHTRLRRKMMDIKAAAEGRENISTPNEMAGLLRAVYQKKFFDAALTDDLFKVLSTPKDSWIPRELPDDLKIANKPGSLEGVRNDSGIIFLANRPYILCVMTTYLRRERDGEQAISRISLAAWRMFDRLSRASQYGRVVSPANSSR
jgi:beta-lactamase class A